MNELLFRQLYDESSSTYTYLLADSKTREAVMIDSVFEQHARDLALLRELDLKLKYVLDTHCHADHVTGAWLMKKASGCQIVLAKKYNAKNVDFPVEDGDQVVFGAFYLRVLSTPGHTDGCLSYVTQDKKMAFTGDCLMIRSAGRTDFQQGDAHKMFQSIREKLFSLPDNCFVYPAHDYSGRSVSTIGEEKKFNTRIGGQASEADFVGYMKNLNLPHPKKIDIALPANLLSGMPQDGVYPQLAEWGPVEQTYDGIYQVEGDWLADHLSEVTVLDVRETEEVNTDFYRVKGAIFIPLSELMQSLKRISKDKPVIAVCRSGKRSAQATVLLEKSGYEQCANLKGGLIAWGKLFCKSSQENF